MDGKKTMWGFRVKDAVGPLWMEPNNQELQDGDPRNGSRCAIALAGKRQYDTDYIFIAGQTAWVGMRDDKGEMIVWRFEVTAAARRVIERNDKSQPGHRSGIVRTGFWLKPPRPSNRLGNKRVRIAAGRAAPKKQPILDGRGRGGGESARKQIRTTRDYRGHKLYD